MHRLVFLAFLFVAITVRAQEGPRTWKDHISLNSCNSVAGIGDHIYASYGDGLAHFNENELAPQKLNKINGLTDVGIKLLRANQYNKKLLVVYDNCNIDVIDVNGGITNYPDLMLKTMSAKKIVNEVTFEKQLAYLACGFGIVVFDTDKLEIKETYYIGPNAANVDVRQVAVTADEIFAATPDGMYKAQRNTSLVNYNNWKLNVGLPDAFYNGVVYAGGMIIANKSLFAVDFSGWQDTLYQYVNGVWSVYPHASGQGNSVIKMGYSSGDMFSLLNSDGSSHINAVTGVPEVKLNGFNGNFDYGTLRDNYFHKLSNGYTAYWLADNKFGLSRGFTSFDPQIQVTTDGMNTSPVSNVDILDGVVAVSPSHVFKEGQGNGMREGINIYKDQDWSYVPPYNLDGSTILDINSVLLDRKDKTMMWATSWTYGVLEFKNGKVVRNYTPANAGLDVSYDGVTPWQGALTQDENGNIWFANSESRKYLGVIRRSDRKYMGFMYDNQAFTRRMIIDRNGFFWLAHERDAGLTVFRHNNFTTPEFRKLGSQPGEGNLGSAAVYCIAEDQEGRLWVGTGAGIRVIYNPADIFKNGDHDAQPIKIEQDGNVELLLGAETVVDILVDGANNKWVGTGSGGVYCFSPDGLREIYHFTKETSPLYSNSIVDLNYDEKTGDLYIATEMGLQTFRGIVIAGTEDYSTFHAFPNPVRPGYGGTVLLRGLIDNSVIKITDVAGNLVWETKSTGGQAEWPVTNLSGSRVTAGVYLVYASTTTAEVKTLTKILVMN
jgi:hypothetical protein